MREGFGTLLNIQDLDIKMIRLMNVKRERQVELKKVHSLKQEMQKQVERKQEEIAKIKTDIRHGETRIKEIQEKVSKLESQQASVKKMDEFNALTQELTAAGRERTATEHNLSDMADKLVAEQDVLAALQKTLQSTEENSILLEKEIQASIQKVNEEGRQLLADREKLKTEVSSEMFSIYERLLKNKKDRVLVSIENRTCSGCHIVLTPQQENLVRKQDRLVFCEHCSRILYWQERQVEEGAEGGATKRRRRRVAAVAT
jgi:predicted  nucleic acid-binding Zn-ribbon protein